VKALGADKLRMFIRNDWYLLESIFYSLSNPPLEAYRQMTPEEVARAEAIRRNMAKTVLPLLGMARRVAAVFPPSAVEGKVTAEWLLGKAREKVPELAEAVEAEGERGRRWLRRQAQELVDYLLGRTCYVPGLGMVPVQLVMEAARHAEKGR